ETARQHPEIYIVRMNTDNDHVHLVVEIAPSVSVVSVGYFSSTVGLDEAMIIKYVNYQGQRDKPIPQQGFDFA
ncbi:hypothetical protein EBT25_12195, partial [bacterium]|nr:hypothetical protein [bacterium]